MTWIETISPGAAQGDLAEVYRAIASARGGVAEIHRAQLGDAPATVEALGRGELPESLGPADLALLRWARLGALDPARASNADVETLRSHGFDDRSILDAALTIAYFSFVNRLTLLLGVPLEADYARTCGTVAEDPP